MINKLLKRMRGDEKGITGLETAIILIAFVVVAAVFAYTALSAGLFSTQKAQEAVYSGLKEAQSTLELRGGVIHRRRHRCQRQHQADKLHRIQCASWRAN